MRHYITDVCKVDSHLGTGTLRSITGEFLNETLASEEIGLALLPLSLFENLTDGEIGLFFTVYENAAFFPVADVPDTTRIGSPVIAATAVTAEQTSFPDLREPVIIAVRLNPVQEGVSCASVSCQVHQALCFHLSFHYRILHVAHVYLGISALQVICLLIQIISYIIIYSNT